MQLLALIPINFAKSCNLTCLAKFNSQKNFIAPLLKYMYLKLKLGVFLACHTVAMVTYKMMKIITMCLPMIVSIN